MIAVRVVHAQHPDREHSQDRVFTTPHAVIVLDGASAFTPVVVSPNQYVDHLGEHMAEHLTAEPAADLARVLAEAIRAAAAELALSADGTPSSTVAMLRVLGDRVDLLVLGDTSIFYGDGHPVELIDRRVAELPTPARQRYRDRLAAGHGYDDTHRDLLRRLQRAQRGYRNRPGGFWTAADDPRAADHAYTRTLPTSSLRWAVLATDGVVNTARHLGLDTWAEVAGRDSRGLAELLDRCHRWEDTDPEGQRLPRSKRHDDKTIAAVTDVGG